jgi:hypothetical protein
MEGVTLALLLHVVVWTDSCRETKNSGKGQIGLVDVFEGCHWIARMEMDSSSIPTSKCLKRIIGWLI